MKLINMINDYEVIINYFINENFEFNQYQTYRFFYHYIKKKFKYKSKYEIKKIFFYLLELGYLKKIDKPKKYSYKFINPYKRINRKFFEITFD